jgi:hypothetical protein
MIDHTALWKVLKGGCPHRPTLLPGTRLFIEEPMADAGRRTPDDGQEEREEARTGMTVAELQEAKELRSLEFLIRKTGYEGPRPRVGVPFSQGEP